MSELHNPISVRVYWEDTDAGGVVYYANYLKFMERARTEWLRALGVHQEALRAQEGVQFVVADMQVRYQAPAKLDDMLAVTVTVVEQGRASMLLQQQVWRGDALLVQGQVRVGCVDARTLAPKRMPASVLEVLQLGLGLN
jgi:acyl-CoA thioester hydrolase